MGPKARALSGMVRFVEGVEDMEQLASFRMHELYQVLSDALVVLSIF